MKRIISVFFLIFIQQLIANPIQEAINASSEYDVLEIPKGVYVGNIVIDKPLTLKGIEKGVIVKGTGTGSTIIIKNSYVTVENLEIYNSGRIKKNYDSAIYANDVSQLEIRNNIIKDSFIGIGLFNVKNSKVENNTILGNKDKVVTRGDAMAIFGGQNNLIKNNTIYKKRDLIVDGSYNNKILNNTLKDMRYAIHGMNASGNIFINNKIEDAIAGLYFMYNKNYKVNNNSVKKSKGTKGIGIGLIECYDFEIKENNFIYNTVAMMIDGSPEILESSNYIEKNNFLYNSEAIRFKEILINSATPRGKNHFIANTFDENVTDVVDESSGKELSIDGNWENNYWDKYKGLDENNDGIGDIPYSLYYFADVVWMDRTDAKFFFGSIGMSLRDFLGKIIPTRDPYLMLTDLNPRSVKE